MESIKLYLCLFSAVVLQNVAVDANEKVLAYVVQDLEKDAEIVKEKLESMKYFRDHKLIDTKQNYHNYIDSLIGNTEIKLKSMICKEGTMDKVKAARSYGWGSFQSCVNLTRAFADGEVVIYDTVEYLESVAALIVNITESIAACNHSSPFKAASCIFETIANHSADYKKKSDTILSLLSRMDNITHTLYLDFNSCIFDVQYTVSAYVDKIIIENCEKQSFFKRLLIRGGHKNK